MGWIGRLLKKLGFRRAQPEKKEYRRRTEYSGGDVSSFTSHHSPGSSDGGPRFGGGEFSGGGSGGSWSDSSGDSGGDGGGDGGGGD